MLMYVDVECSVDFDDRCDVYMLVCFDCYRECGVGVSVSVVVDGVVVFVLVVRVL